MPMAGRSDSHAGVEDAPLVRLAYVGNFLSRHGINPTYAEELVPRLRGAGFEVAVASESLPLVRRLWEQLVVVARMPRRRACVVIDFYSGPRAFYAGIVVALACRLLGRQYILVLHGGELPRRLEGSRAVLRRVFRGASAVTSPSAYLARHFAPLAPVEVIGNGIDAGSYDARLRTNPRPSIAYLRAFERMYGCLELVEAFAMVVEQRPDATLEMIGPDKDGSRAACEALAKKLGVADRVTFKPRIPKSEVRRVGDHNDVFVNPTFADNTPVSVIEAMALGMCIVSTNAGGLQDLLEHERSAVIVPVGDVAALAAGILRVLADPALASRISAGARHDAEELDWSHVVPAWTALIDRVVR
jgi:glycosyltransferase involved in cell wall biosynthesis